jgi:putative aldouronate transport system substrate-binding protein
MEEELGIVPMVTSWEWEGGSGYVQGLRLALAGGEEFEMIRPWTTEMAQELIDGGVALPLDDLLEEHGQNILALYPDEVWDNLRRLQGGAIYWLPNKGSPNTYRVGMIRRDWLDRVGLDVPTTKQELLEVYRAFRDQDANGNGDPNDEIPVSGRELFRWFDDLFVMHGVAMYEGHPHWHYDEDEELFESHQVSDEMFNALTFINQLYNEGLMDPVMPTQPREDWGAKINNDRVGHYFHLIGQNYGFSEFARSEENHEERGDEFWAIMEYPPVVEGVGRQMNYFPDVQNPWFMITTWAEDPVKIMQWLDWGASDQYPESIFGGGLRGLDWVENDDGSVEIIRPQSERPSTMFKFGSFPPFDPRTLENRPFGEFHAEAIETLQGKTQNLPDMFMPSSVYDGLSDFAPNQARLYREIAGQLITQSDPPTRGQWDAYVEQWYAAGGRTVTERANEWYRDFYGLD